MSAEKKNILSVTVDHHRNNDQSTIHVWLDSALYELLSNLSAISSLAKENLSKELGEDKS